jgi:intracellular sulfur oxidation DsrE/DsrF family protein
MARMKFAVSWFAPLAGILAQGLTGCASMSHNTTGPGVIPVQNRRDIRVVYQVTNDEWEDGIGKGLFYVRKLSDAYESMGILASEVHISAVFHGKAGYWLLKDSPYGAAAGQTSANPNKDIVRELTERGVSIELCADTMRQHGWTADDVLPSVRIVVGAYPRIIDLQRQRYAYIRF